MYLTIFEYIRGVYDIIYDEIEPQINPYIIGNLELFQNNIEVGLNNITNSQKWNSKPTYLCSDFSV